MSVIAAIKKRIPVRIEILSSAENTSLLHNNLNHILLDESCCWEEIGNVEKDRSTRVKIECTVREQKKHYISDQLRLKLPPDCYISAEPTELLIEPILVS
ncbi:MAG: hypothetical protein DLM72_14650 [Candidatus Nitrosopolaris wilkensis]|nr:MAG: hypothetical protein DLM72_14650 [Candidatus Nitrosopolaris wilkensis]